MKFRKSMTRKESQDRGAVLIWFAAATVVSLGMGALVIDVGALWSERRQLQNGADAAALAVAIECAAGPCPAAQQIAKDYANANVNDGSASIDRICGRAFPHLPVCDTDPPEVPTSPNIKFVEVFTGTSDTPGGSQGEVDYLLAPALDASNAGKHVTARALAIWGPASSAKVMAMVLGKCSFDPSWINSDGVADFGNANIAVEIHSGTTCSAGYPQGFDFTTHSGDCLATVNRGDGTAWIDKKSEGMSPTCKDILLNSILSNEPILIPIASGRTPPGGDTRYQIDGFALVTVCGVRIPGLRTSSCGFPCPISGSGSTQVLCGSFTTGTLPGSDVGDGTNYGVPAVQLIG
jgi:hypothetical protein